MDRVVRYGLSLVILVASSAGPPLGAQDFAGQPSLYPGQSSKPRVLVSDSQ